MTTTELNGSSAPHYQARTHSDRFAQGATRLLWFFADKFFAKRYGHRAIVLETVAAVPGMVGAMATHLHCLRRMIDDDGWIRILMDEAENERMHLMTFIELANPTGLERVLVLVAQWISSLSGSLACTWHHAAQHTGRWAISKKKPCSAIPVPGGDRCQPRSQRAGARDCTALLEVGR